MGAAHGISRPLPGGGGDWAARGSQSKWRSAGWAAARWPQILPPPRTRRRSWRQQVCSMHVNTCAAAFLPDMSTPCLKGGTTLITFSLPRARLEGLCVESVAALGACSLFVWVQGALDREGRLENGAGGVDSVSSWTDLTSGKVVATTDVLCAGGAGSCLDNFVVSIAVAHMVQGVVRVEKSPTTSHWPVRAHSQRHNAGA